MTTIISQGSMFDEMLGDIAPNKGELYPFNVRVGLVKYRPPRHDFFEFMQYMGKLDIGPILYHEKFNPASVLTFVFPEAWMSVHEERMFMYKLKDHPEVANIKQVDIITKSVMIVSDFKSEMVRVITWPDDDKYENIGKT
jgi:hypothetical protein